MIWQFLSEAVKCQKITSSKKNTNELKPRIRKKPFLGQEEDKPTLCAGRSSLVVTKRKFVSANRLLKEFENGTRMFSSPGEKNLYLSEERLELLEEDHHSK